ncbi:MAG: hypothetical protein K9N47_16405 [Prosthecobacter sp.]|uniref:hypothetical protein n=1 Tax=Prosthecobacter sp. TaxID=1965333 RepID=UPI0025D78A53|nr:hypothetical protein [Prosthecobacter sp.]MCF7787713.1 hypothetical protein [Prosthecobacter sp.]
MKTKLIKSIITGLMAISALALVSCQATSAKPASYSPTSAVTCSKCHTVTFKSPSVTSAAGDKGIVTLRSSSHMSCPDCQTKLVAWGKKGELPEHSCKTCGGTMHHCTMH